MTLRDELKAGVLNLGTTDFTNETERDHFFEQLALEIFHFQAVQNPVYRKYIEYLGIKPSNIQRVGQIPCLPISFFKTQRVLTGNTEPQLVFESSGTTGQTPSRHYVSDLPFYEAHSQQIFEQMYGSLLDYHVLALLPSYLERNNSSLVYMVQRFIYHSYSPSSGFYLKNTRELLKKLEALVQDSRKILLLGVTFALLDLAENDESLDFIRENKDKFIIMETGGMKGKRKELLREEVHEILTENFGVSKIHSEYGMTELLSQGYSKGDGIFTLPPSMKVLLREVNDPFTYLPSFAIGEKANPNQRMKTGGINVIDLANIDSCCFIETQDLGSFTPDYSGFKVLGRFDNSDVRGCNLMVL
ncbi:MAG: acyl transferase [Spirosomaceae bacterium]|nr:acyl transferase [Spirosomataceae bacterium]